MKLSPRVFFKPMILWLFILSALVIPWVASAALVSGAGGMALSPHHASSGETHNKHYFKKTKDDHHFAWTSATPTPSGIITINYDFRPQNGATNKINLPANAGQKAAAIAAFNAWSAATNGKIQFVQSTSASSNAIINVGTGNLAALGYSSGVGGVLGLGGGTYRIIIVEASTALRMQLSGRIRRRTGTLL